MRMSEPIITAAREILATALADMRPAVEGASPEALNWRPAAEANSIAVLAVHQMNSTRMWLSVATGALLPERDRDSEFVATTADASALLAIVDAFGRDCETLLANAEEIDWSAMRETHPRPPARRIGRSDGGICADPCLLAPARTRRPDDADAAVVGRA